MTTVPDDELLQRLAALLRSSRRTEADLVAHIGEVDVRRLYAREASPSMWAYCTERLHLSGAEAYLRIAAARASREHPVLLDMLGDGRLHLTAIALLAPYLTPENREHLLRRATHKSKREVEELVAEIDPRPDAPARIRKLPDRVASTAPAAALAPAAPGTAPSLSPSPTADVSGPVLGHDTSIPRRCVPADETIANGDVFVTRDHQDSAVSSVPVLGECCAPPQTPRETATASGPALRLDEVVSRGLDGVARPPSRLERVASRSATVQPLSPARYKVQFTASAELREKLERL